MFIAITGGTGFIGRALCRRLLGHGHRLCVLSRRPERVPQLCGAAVAGVASGDWAALPETPAAIINLAGAGIADRPWTAARRRELRGSRIDVTRALVDWLERSGARPAVLISGSAVGYYGDQGETLVTEHCAPGEDFGARLCRDWEAEARRAEALGVRVCLLRTAPVLGPDGGMLRRLLPPFRFGLGGRIGSGRQWLPWIHREDWLSLAEHLLEHPDLAGAFNACAPNPVTNREFTAALARQLGRPALLPVPAVGLRLLLGEMAELLLGGQRAEPAHALETGFRFRFAELRPALADILDH